MHSAPAVSYPVGRSFWRTAALLSPWVLAALACLYWAYQADHLSAAHGLALLLWLAGSSLAWFELRRPTHGLLSWDGQSWSWEAGRLRAQGRVQARLDWQRGLLLEFRGLDARRHWLWVERRMAPLAWDGLRRAVYAVTVPEAAAPAAAGPAETGL
jgi:hypothetical protein